MTVQTVVDEARIEQFYREIEQMVVTLEEDFTYQMFNRKSVLLRTFMDRIGMITTQVSADLHRVSRHLLKLEKMYELERDSLLASDMRVRAERTHAAQLAKVAFILQTSVQEINGLTIQKKDLEQMLSLLKLKLQDLHNAQSSLRDQRKAFELIHQNGKGLPAITDSVRTMESNLDDLLSGIQPTTVSPVEDFLDSPDAGAFSGTPNLDLDQILQTIPSLEELRKSQK